MRFASMEKLKDPLFSTHTEVSDGRGPDLVAFSPKTASKRISSASGQKLLSAVVVDEYKPCETL